MLWAGLGRAELGKVDALSIVSHSPSFFRGGARKGGRIEYCIASAECVRPPFSAGVLGRADALSIL